MLTHTAKLFNLRFLRKEKIAHDAYSFYFERSNFNFLPGQHLRMTLEISQPDERGNSRIFTIASSPTEQDHLMITTRIIQSTFKKTLVNLEIDQRVDIFGPLGNFTIQKDKALVFLAGGIGITPFRSMLIYVADKKLNIPIILFTSFRTTQDMIFQKELKEIADNYSWFALVQTITKPEESLSIWQGETGRINAELMTKYIKNISSSSFYISGPPAMVDDLLKLVKSLKVSESQIRTEKFIGY